MSHNATSASNTARDGQLKTIAVVVRALVTSQKPPCSLLSILRDYKDVEGQPLPYQSLGFRSPESLLEETGEFIIHRHGGDIYVSVRHSEKTAHIASMVLKQKESKSKKRVVKPVILQVRRPIRPDRSWNRRIVSVSAKLGTANVYIGDRNKNNNERPYYHNNNNNINNRNTNYSNLYPQATKQSMNPISGSPKKMPENRGGNQDLRHALNAMKTQKVPLKQERIPPPRQSQPHQQLKPQTVDEKVCKPRAILGPNYKIAGMADNKHPLMERNTPVVEPKKPLFKSSIQNRLKVEVKTNTENSNAWNGDKTPTPETTPSPTLDQVKQSDFQKRQPSAEIAQQKNVSPKGYSFNTNDPINSLAQYCRVKGYAQPVYNTIRSKFSSQYQCGVHINDIIYSSYPNEFDSEYDAQIFTTLKAIEEIKIQETRRPLPPCTDSDTQLIKKLYDELLQHPYGIFAKNIPEWFEGKFSQTIPEHWWTLVQTSNKFITEKAVSNNNNSVIIFANKVEVQEPILTNVDDVTFPMECLTLPWSEKYWSVLITHCGSTTDVWGRLFGEYSDRFENLISNIENYMATEKKCPQTVSCKQYYLVTSSDCWHRVRVDELNEENGLALCFFMDFGESEWLDIGVLYICEPAFLSLPPQAVPLALFGLEDFADSPCARRHLDELLHNRSLVAEIVTKHSDFNAAKAKDEEKVEVVLYDTSSQDDINLNQQLQLQICEDTLPPQIRTTGVTKVNVTHITDRGIVYIQLLTSHLEYMTKLLQQVESKVKTEQYRINRNDLKRSNLFLIRYDAASDGQPGLYRGALTDPQISNHDEEYNIFFVDHGFTRSVHISKIFRLESLSMALNKFPAQALRVELHNVPPMSENILGRMRALLPLNREALVKLAYQGETPSVIIYRRNDANDTLCTINDDLRIEHELRELAEESEPSPKSDGLKSPGGNQSVNDSKQNFVGRNSFSNSPVKSVDLPKLKPYSEIPDIEEYFDVRVVMAVNPSSFKVHAYKDAKELSAVMNELQKHCEKQSGAVPIKMIELGQAYAARSVDGFYYRVVVTSIFNGGMIQVSFVDYGGTVVLRSDQLKMLPARFRQLPIMAIQAKLHGITARETEWSKEDCLRFRELCVGKKFVAVVKKDFFEEHDLVRTRVLEVQLVDVATQEDVYIHELLIEENRAVKQE